MLVFTRGAGTGKCDAESWARLDGVRRRNESMPSFGSKTSTSCSSPFRSALNLGETEFERPEDGDEEGENPWDGGG